MDFLSIITLAILALIVWRLCVIERRQKWLRAAIEEKSGPDVSPTGAGGPGGVRW